MQSTALLTACAICFGVTQGFRVTVGIVTDSEEEWTSISTEVESLISSSTFNISLKQFVATSDVFRLSIDICSHTSEGLVALISTADCNTFLMLRSLCSDVGIPFIQAGAECVEQALLDDGQNSAQFKPTLPVEVISSVVSHLEGGNVIFITDNYQDPEIVNSITSACVLSNITVEMFRIQGDKIDQQVVSVLDFAAEKSATTEFIVFCESACITALLKQANLYSKHGNIQNQALFTFDATYLFITMDKYNIDVIVEQARTVVNVILLTSAERNLSLHYVKNSISQVTNALEAVSRLNGTEMNHLMEYNATSCGEILKLVEEMKRELLGQYNSTACTSCATFEVHSVQWDKDMERALEMVAEWFDGGDHLVMHHESLMPNRQRGFNGITLRIGTNWWTPFVVEDDSAASVYGVGGLSIELLKELSKNLNFSYTLHFPDDGGWGSLIDNSWSGLVGMLVSKEVDMVVAPLGRTTDREVVVDFTGPYYLDHVTVLVKYPDLDDHKWKLFINPFRWQVWLLLSFTIPFAGLILWIFSRYSPHYTEKESHSGLGLIDNSIFYTFGAFFTQGGVFLPTAQSGRFFVGFYWMSCIVIVATYSGNLIAFLTVSRDVLPFSNIEEMLEQDTYTYGVLNNTAISNYVQTASDPTMLKLQAKMESFAKSDPDIFTTNHTVHINKVIAGDYAYIGDTTAFELEMSKTCDIDMINDNFVPYEYSVALWENSAYLSMVGEEVRMIKEAGLVKKWKADWWPRQSFCSRGLVTEAKAVSMDDVQGAYYLMGMLLVVSFAALMVESMWRRNIQRSSKVESNTPVTPRDVKI